MSNGTGAPNEDPLPAFMLASWLAFLIPAAYACVHGPDLLADVFVRLADLSGQPVSAEGVFVVRAAGSVLLGLASAVLFSGYLLYTFAPPAIGSSAATCFGALGACVVSACLFPFAAWIWGGVWETRVGAGLFTGLAWLLYLRRAADT